MFIVCHSLATVESKSCGDDSAVFEGHMSKRVETHLICFFVKMTFKQ